MIYDTSLQLANATSVAAVAGTSLIGSQIDASVAGTLDAEELYLTIVVTTGITVAASTGTIQFKLASDTTAAVSTTTSLDEVITPAFVTSTTAIPVGTILHTGELPKDIGTATLSRRFLGLLLVVGTTTINAGAVSAFLTTQNGKWAALPVAVN